MEITKPCGYAVARGRLNKYYHAHCNGKCLCVDQPIVSANSATKPITCPLCNQRLEELKNRGIHLWRWH